MGVGGVKTITSQLFAVGDQLMKVSLFRAKVGYRVHCQLRQRGKKGRSVLSGYTALAQDEKQAHEDFDWACEEARKKGWQPGPKRGGGKLRMLDGVPAPLPRQQKPAETGPAPLSRLMRRHDEAIERARKRA